jgi:hypothetical protein
MYLYLGVNNLSMIFWGITEEGFSGRGKDGRNGEGPWVIVIRKTGFYFDYLLFFFLMTCLIFGL